MGKRILITSIPSWNQLSGANTWPSLFGFADPKDVASIYIDSQKPDSKVASRYFNINESLVVKSVFNRNVKTGREIDTEHVSSRNNKPCPRNKSFSLAFFKKHRSFLLLWLRELAWFVGRWKTKELNDFVQDFNPDVLVISVESYPYYNRINEYIIDKYKPKKVVAFLWDDNFTYKQHPHSLIFMIERFFLRKQVRRIISKSDKILAISPKMKEECDKEFGIDSVVLTKPILHHTEFYLPKINSPIRILYTGKLIIGRDKTIAEIVKAIKIINLYGPKVILDIYTQTDLPDSVRQKIDIPGSCVIHKPIPQSEVIELQRKADVLLFVESLSSKDLTARLSFSTKLTDYFSAGKCIWAVGNEDLGPIDYIKHEDAGFVSTNSEAITDVLNNMIKHPEDIVTYSKKSFDCGKLNHDSMTIFEKLRTIIDND